MSDHEPKKPTPAFAEIQAKLDAIERACLAHAAALGWRIARKGDTLVVGTGRLGSGGRSLGMARRRVVGVECPAWARDRFVTFVVLDGRVLHVLPSHVFEANAYADPELVSWGQN